MTSRLSPIVMALSLLSLAPTLGCDDTEMRSLSLADLPERLACDDVTVVATTDDASEALLISVEDGLVATAQLSGEAVEAVYTLPDDRLIVRWVGGSNVVEGRCGHLATGEWRLDERHDAVAGTLRVRVAPRSYDDALMFSAELDGLEFATEGSDGELLPLDRAFIKALPLGD